MQYQFDLYTLDTARLKLRMGEESLHCKRQAIALLGPLIENHDRMVSKEEINQTIWHGRIVSEAALSSRIKMVRQLLGDDGRTQRFIRTVHKRGFRFVARVALVQESDITIPAKTSEPGSGNGSSPLGQKRKLTHSTAVVVLPFSNLSSESGHEYLSDGRITDIIGHLAKHRGLDVFACITAFGFKGR